MIDTTRYFTSGSTQERAKWVDRPRGSQFWEFKNEMWPRQLKSTFALLFVLIFRQFSLFRGLKICENSVLKNIYNQKYVSKCALKSSLLNIKFQRKPPKTEPPHGYIFSATICGVSSTKWCRQFGKLATTWPQYNLKNNSVTSTIFGVHIPFAIQSFCQIKQCPIKELQYWAPSWSDDCNSACILGQLAGLRETRPTENILGLRLDQHDNIVP